MFDLLATATLSGAAAWVIAAYSVALGASTRERFLIAAGMTIWLAAVLWLGAAQVLSSITWLGLPGLAWVVALPIVVLSTLLLGTREGRRRVMEASLPVMIGVQSVRVLGIWFVLLHAAGRLPAPFAPVAGWGDVLAGILAVPVAWMAARFPGRGRGAILGWNLIGAIDLIAAVSLGLTSLPGPLRLFMEEPGSAPMNVLPWIIIPGFLVPSLLALHAAIFYRLGRRLPAVSYA